MLVDTHAHIHFAEYEGELDGIIANAKRNHVSKIITVGTDDGDSRQALDFCLNNQAQAIDIYATAGLHPHEADAATDKLLTIKELAIDVDYDKALVAIGECGLDYFKNYADKKSQYRALEFQIELAIGLGLPLVFHVRDAWEDFFSILKNYPSARGVIHSFTGGPKQVEQAQEAGLYFGLNGIMTFTKQSDQLEAAKAIPKNKLLLETDCPFLSPEPMRGKRNEPSNIKYIAEFMAKLRSETISELSQYTSTNAKTLFGLK